MQNQNQQMKKSNLYRAITHYGLTQGNRGSPLLFLQEYVIDVQFRQLHLSSLVKAILGDLGFVLSPYPRAPETGGGGHGPTLLKTVDFAPPPPLFNAPLLELA